MSRVDRLPAVEGAVPRQPASRTITGTAFACTNESREAQSDLGAALALSAADSHLRIPVQLNLLTGEPEPVRIDVEAQEEGVEERVGDGISMVKGELGETVILTGFGLYLGKKSERLTVKAPGGAVIYQFPFFRLQEVVVGSRGISLSSDLIEALCERGIRVAFLKGRKRRWRSPSPCFNRLVSARPSRLAATSSKRLATSGASCFLAPSSRARSATSAPFSSTSPST